MRRIIDGKPMWILLALLTAFIPASTAAHARDAPMAGPLWGADAGITEIESDERFIEAHPFVRVGLIPGFAPYMFVGKDGAFQGIIPDYLRLLEGRAGISFRHVPLDLAELDAAMGAGIDLFPGVESPGRRRRMAFTEAFMSDPWVLVVRRDAPLVTGVRDFRGRTISLVDNIYIHGRLEADYPDIRIHPAGDHPRALEAVSTGRADAYIGPLSVAGYLMLHNRLTHLKIAAPSGYPPAEVKFGVRKDWPELVGILDRAVSTVSRREVDALFRKWVPVQFQHRIDWTHVWKWIAGIVGVFGLLLALSFLWNRRLAAEIAQRKTAQGELRKIEWLLARSASPSDAVEEGYQPPYGDVTALNTCRVIMDSVSKETLKRIAEDAIDLLETSVAIYERNGDYAFGMFSSGWCRLFDLASRNLCGTDDNRHALGCGKWLCHENCWNDSAKAAILSGKPTDIECVGGIRLYGVPIHAGEEVVGAINIGYGDPPTDEAAVRELAERFRIPAEEVRACQRAYPSRPAYIIALAKKRLRTAAALIGEIVERKRAEKGLEKSQAILKKAEELSEIGGYEYDIPSGRLVFSDGWMTIHGCEKRTLSVEELMPIALPEDVPRIEKAFDRAMRNIQPYCLEHRIVRQNDGVVRTIRASAETVFDEAGRPVKLYGSVQDITEREAAERALRESEAKLQAILNSTEQSFALVDGNGAILAFNRIADEFAQEIFGRGIQVGQSLADFVDPANLDSFHRHFRRALEGTPVVVEREMPGGHWFFFSYNPVFDSTGEVTGVCFNCRNVTDRKRAEIALQTSETRFRHLFEYANDGICIVDPDGRIIMANQRMCDLFGYDSDEMAQKTVHDLSHPEDRDVSPGVIEQYRTGEIEYTTFEKRFVTKQGDTLWGQVASSVVRDRAGDVAYYLSHLRDITGRKRADEQLKQYAARLEEMVGERTRELEKAQEDLILKERLAVLGNLSGSISHELRNPLAAIDSSVYLLKIKLGGEVEKVGDHLRRISSNIRQANGIIQSLLDLTRMEKPRTLPVDLRRLVPEVLRGNSIPDTVRIETAYPEEDLPAAVDAQQIRMALKNIVRNAIQAMEGAGTLRVAVRSAAPDRAVVVVSDSGPGIPTDEMEKIFQPLYSTKVHGIGFGLSISKMIAEKHGGDLTVESTPGRGAAFILALPRVRKEEKSR